MTPPFYRVCDKHKQNNETTSHLSHVAQSRFVLSGYFNAEGRSVCCVRNERLAVLLYSLLLLLLKQQGDNDGCRHGEVDPLELIMGREGKLRKMLQMIL